MFYERWGDLQTNSDTIASHSLLVVSLVDKNWHVILYS